MSDVYEIVNYEGVDRPEYILRNGRPINIFGAKKILESQMEQIERLSEQVKRFADALISSQEKVDTLREALEIVRPDIYYNQDGDEVCAGGNFTIDNNGIADDEAMQQIHEALEATKAAHND